LFSSALSMFDRRRLSVIEVSLRFIAAFSLLALSPLIHIPALVVGILLVLYDKQGTF